MNKLHQYRCEVEWTGNTGDGTRHYRGYGRNHLIRVNNKAVIEASSDPAFRGDKRMHTPEELFVASIASCHMLWYLHLCSDAGVVVTAYTDHAVGTMIETADGGGHFREVTLHPEVVITEASLAAAATALHQRAGELCFIARSCNFPIHHEPVILVRPGNAM